MHDITHLQWSNQSAGLRESQIGRDFIISVKDIKGELLHPGVFNISREDAVKRYGIVQINKPSLMGVWIPRKELHEFRVR